MTTVPTAPPTTAAIRRVRSTSRRSGGWRILRDPLGAASLAIIVVIVLLVVFADIVAPLDPTRTDLSITLTPPSWEHLLGTDSVGRDIWSRVLHGGQTTLLGTLIVVVVSTTIGLIGGLVAGYVGGAFDLIASWVVALLLSLPTLVIILAMRSTLGASMVAVMVVFGILVVPAVYQLVRTVSLTVRNEAYVEAAIVSGISDVRIVFFHVLSAVRAPVVIQLMLIAAGAISIQAALDFLGLGGDQVTWGGMMSEGFSQIYNAPQLLFWPALFLGLMSAALVVLGNSIRDAIDPRAQTDVKSVLRWRPSPRPPAGTGAPLERLLVVEGLTVAYPMRDGGVRTVLDDVSIAVDRGEVVGLIGESGSGKTQVVLSVLGLLPPGAMITGGRVGFAGVELLGLSERQLRSVRVGGIAYVPQEPVPNLDPSFTVGFQLVEVLRTVRGLSRSEARDRALQLLESVRIVDPAAVMKSYPHQISGGMAQRVLIAGALAMDPQLLIADEPTTALDVSVQAEILDLLRELQRARNLGVLFVTHDLGVAADLCDRMVVLKSARVVETGSVYDVFDRPREEYTRSLIAATDFDAPPRPALQPPAEVAS